LDAAEKVLIFDFLKIDSQNIAIYYVKVVNINLKKLNLALKMGNQKMSGYFFSSLRTLLA